MKSVGTDKKAPDIIEQSLCKNIEEQVKKSIPLFRNVQDIYYWEEDLVMQLLMKLNLK